jgi:hypothetical protein
VFDEVDSDGMEIDGRKGVVVCLSFFLWDSALFYWFFDVQTPLVFEVQKPLVFMRYRHLQFCYNGYRCSYFFWVFIWVLQMRSSVL